METSLRQEEGWYLGENGEAAANEILRNSDRDNVFLVYKSPDTNNYVLSVRLPSSRKQKCLIETYIISSTYDGCYKITGQSDTYNSVIDAVNSFTKSRDMVPALDKESLNNLLEQQFMVSCEPPEYDKANQVLGPDIALLPTIKGVYVEKPKKAKTGVIRPNLFEYDHIAVPGEPDYMSNPHWWRYRDKNCCHPKNTWHCCCHRPTYWDVYQEEEVPDSEWFNCCDTGCLRCLLLISMWYFLWPCVSFALCVLLCIYCCCSSCLDDD